MNKIICLLIIVTFTTPVFAKTLHMMMGVEEKTEGFKTAKRILDAIGERIGEKFTLTSLPSGRANILFERDVGYYDGEVVVYEGRKIKNPDVIRVPEPFFQTSIVAVVVNEKIRIIGWEGLKNYRLTHLRGWSVVETPLEKVNLTSRALDSTDSALNFLLAKRAEIFLVTPLVVKKALKKQKFKNKGLIVLKQPVGKVNLHTYFYKRYSDISHKYNEALKAMKQDGSYQKSATPAK